MLEGPRKEGRKEGSARKWRDNAVTVGEAPGEPGLFGGGTQGLQGQLMPGAGLFAYLGDLSHTFLSIVISFLPFYLTHWNNFSLFKVQAIQFSSANGVIILPPPHFPYIEIYF